MGTERFEKIEPMNCAAPSRRRFLATGASAAVALIAGAPPVHAASGATVSSDAGVALVFDPIRKNLIKASASGLARSNDGGNHWTPLAAPAGLPSASVRSLAVAAGGKGTLYVAGHGVGVMRSDDGGRHWSPRDKGLPGKEPAAVAAHADRPETIYAYFEGRGFFRSEDGGRQWRLMDKGPSGGITQFVHSNMPGSMQSGWLFAAAPTGVQRSMDCFCGWRDAGHLARPVRAVAYDPRQPRTVHAAAGAQLLTSSDGGATWTPSSAPPAPVEALVVADGVLIGMTAGGRVFRRGTPAGGWERADA